MLVAGSASLLDSSAIISVGSALPLWRVDLALSNAEVGAVSATMTLAIAAGALIGGPLADLIGRGRVFAAMVGLYVVGAGLVAGASSWPVLVAAVGILGFASGADLPASIALVADRVPRRLRGRMVAATHVMWTVGIVVSSAAAFAVASRGLAGMRGVFAGLAVVAMVTWAARRHALARLPPAADPGTTAPDATQHHQPAETARGLARIAVFYVLYTLVANTFGSFRPYLLVTVGGASQSAATGFAFATTLVGLIGTLVFSFVADSPWRRAVYPWAAALLVVSQGMLAMTVDRSLTTIVAALVLYALAYPYVGEALYKVWAQEVVAPRHRAAFQGVTIAAARAVAALFALVTPSLLARSPSGMFWLLTVVASAAVATGWRSRSSQARE
ncbi:MFS transporter [Nocardioides xinjiangensis]|uniref:MFS transporter n=1 Tax=Nocardioides xinjiangensis TaxID=2817376 RepID=UPI001B307F5B|nr:MFS transporter [Nocardioides sp. SYSU D00778]